MFRQNGKIQTDKKQTTRDAPVKTLPFLVKIFVIVVTVATFIVLFADAPSSISYFTDEARSQKVTVEIND